MKTSLISFIVGMITLSSACSSNPSSNETQIAGNSSTEKKVSEENSSATSGDGIVGTWKLRLDVFDDNSNRIPDEEELKKGYANNYMLQLNADGSCRIQQIFTGRYEKKTESGKDMLYVYRKKVEGEEDKDPPPDIFQVISVKKDELVLLVIMAGEPTGFWFFKRVK